VKIVGIDLSLSSTGLAVITNGRADVVRHTTAPVGDDLARRHRRLLEIADAVRTWASGADLAVLEGPSYASVTGHQHDRSGLWWLVVARLLGAELPLAVVPPTSRARYATGKGNAAKDAVLAAVVRRYPEVDIIGNDQADALILAAMGARRLGHPIDVVPKACLTGMAGATWPPESGLL
jgi:crossover junction endodeoxyribonuclease RuvC